MKTATIDVYHVFGSKNAIGISILYRGFVWKMYTKPSSEKTETLASALAYAKNAGFTHARFINENNRSVTL